MNKKEKLQKRLREMSPSRKEALVKGLVGLNLPEIAGTEEVASKVASALGKDAQAGLAARRAYDAVSGRGKKP